MSALAERSLASRQELARAFADVLSYPHASPAALAASCRDVVRARSREAAELLTDFAALAETEPLGTLQEEYTRAFDLDTMSRTEPTCYPYVGHYLFDESHKRGAFILGLRKRFRACGFADESDLADHLVVLLRFLAACEDEELSDELVDDAVLPALERMGTMVAATSGEGAVRGAYLGVLRALELALRAERPAPADDPQRAELEREWARNKDSLGIDRDWCGH